MSKTFKDPQHIPLKKGRGLTRVLGVAGLGY